MRPNVLKQSLGQIRANPPARPTDHPRPGLGYPGASGGAWGDKCLYVWFEAVIGYLSAAVEWASLTDDKKRLAQLVVQPEAKGYYFIGKDNIPFHAVMWPAQLSGAGEWFGKIFEGVEGKDLTLPYDVPANEFMNMEDRKISGSRNWAVWGLDALSRYDADALRFYLTINMPETKDSNWDWDDFVARNNNPTGCHLG